jgi:competence protein ComEC
MSWYDSGMKPRISFAALLCSLTLFSAKAGLANKTLDIYWVDVEGGAATLIVTPNGESVLIDSGNPGGRDSGRIHNVASHVAGLKKIDHLITTHMHTDHFGGAAELAKLIPVENVHDNGIPDKDPDQNPSNNEAFAKRIQPYREIKAKRSEIAPGEVIPLAQTANSPRLELKCIAAKQKIFGLQEASANANCAEAKLQEKDISDNANSIITLLRFGDFKFFDGGDVTWNVEKELVCPFNKIGTIDVYQVSHHGLDVSNNPLLVHALRPTVSVMSNGTQKGCGAATFATLKASPGLKGMYQIHRNLRADKENNTSEDHIANLEAKCEANYIMLSVEPSGKSYTVSIPARGHKATYQTK